VHDLLDHTTWLGCLTPPGWPVRVFISRAAADVHATPYCPLLKGGQEKASDRGHIVTRVVCVSMIHASKASVGASVLANHPVESPPVGDTFQLVLAGVLEQDSGPGDEILDGLGHEHLRGFGGRRNPSAD